MTREEAIKYAKFRLECYSKGDGKYTEHGEFLVAAIEALQEPERMKGRWIEIIKDKRFGDEWDEIAIYKCSVCESEFVECMGTYNFCPNCGADMRGEEE